MGKINRKNNGKEQKKRRKKTEKKEMLKFSQGRLITQTNNCLNRHVTRHKREVKSLRKNLGCTM